MASLTGRTNAKHIRVFLDAVGGSLTEITAYTRSVGSVGLTHDTADVTSYSDGTKNVSIGQPSAPLQFSGPFDTTAHTLFTGLEAAGGRLTTGDGLSLDIRIGIRATADETDEPQFGITGSATIGYQLVNYTLGSDLNWTATLEPFGPTVPAWSTSVET